MSGASSEPPSTWPGVLAVALWQIAASACYYAVFASTESVRTAFDLSGFEVGVLVTTLTLGYTVFLFPAGMLVDGYGDRPAMVLGLLGLAAGALGVSAAPTYPVLLGAAFVLGAAYATAMPATNRAVAVRAPSGRYNLAVGVKQVGVTLGSALAALLVTGIVARGGSWRDGFLVVAAAAFLAAVGYALRYEGADAVGDAGLPDLGSLRGDPAYLALAAGGFFVGAAIFTTTGYAVPYFGGPLGASVGVAGVALATMQVTGSAGRVGAGALADRLPGSTTTAALGVLLVQATAAAVLLAVLPAVPLVPAFGVAALLGVGLLGVTGLYHGSLVALVDPDETGAATAGGQTTLNAGGLLVPPLFGLLADGVGFTAGWWLLAALMACAVACTLAARRLAA